MFVRHQESFHKMSVKTTPQPWDVSSATENVLADLRAKTLRTPVLDAPDEPNAEAYAEVLRAVEKFPHHRYLLTTANPVEVLKQVRDAELPDEVDIWVGVEADDVDSARRASSFIEVLDTDRVFLHIPRLLGMPCEEFLDSVTRGKAWVILGSADTTTPMHPEWVRTLRDHCVLEGGAFRFESWGAWVENAVVTSDEYVVRVPRVITPHHCAVHLTGRVALCPSNPSNPFLHGEEGWTVLRRAAVNDPALTALDGKVWSEEPFLDDEPDIPLHMLSLEDDEYVWEDDDADDVVAV